MRRAIFGSVTLAMSLIEHDERTLAELVYVMVPRTLSTKSSLESLWKRICVDLLLKRSARAMEDALKDEIWVIGTLCAVAKSNGGQ